MDQIIPARTGEKAQYLVHPYNDNTIRFVLHYPGPIDAGCMSRAVRAVVMSVDILHGSFFLKGAKAFWRLNDPKEEDYFRLVSTGEDPCRLALEPVALEARAQLQVSLAGHSLVVRMSHLCVDGGDGKYLLKKLIEAYNRVLATGSAEGLQIKNGSREPQQVWEHLGLKDRLSLMKVPFSGVKSEFPYPTDHPGQPGALHRVIPRQTMAAARARGKTQGATANDLLLTACYRAYASLPGVRKEAPMAVACMMDVRRHCRGGDSAGLCNLSGSLPTSLPDGVNGDFSRTLSQIAAQTRAVKTSPLAGLEGVPLLYGMAKRVPLPILSRFVGIAYGNMNLGLTNLGDLSPADFALDGMAPTGGMAGGPVKKKPGMQVTVISFGGSCTLAIVGRFTAEDQPLLEGLLDEMVQQLTDYAENR